MYNPKPVDTSNIIIPAGLEQLTESIAENVHEVWAQGRIKDGWVYGEKRDDVKRTTPCLVPYNQLTEEEKQYDRNTAMGTIKLIMAMGYQIVKK